MNSFTTDNIFIYLLPSNRIFNSSYSICTTYIHYKECADVLEVLVETESLNYMIKLYIFNIFNSL